MCVSAGLEIKNGFSTRKLENRRDFCEESNKGEEEGGSILMSSSLQLNWMGIENK